MEEKSTIKQLSFEVVVGNANDTQAQEIARKHFGIKQLSFYQRLVIANILDSVQAVSQGTGELRDGINQVVLLPTGAGKTLCFLVPALMLQGATLVIYPLLALMTDQERRMKDAGISCVVFRGGQSESERQTNFEKIANGARIIITNPEMLENESLLKRLASCNIEHIAIDEAHCVSEWGDTFRPSYLKLGSVIETLGVKTVSAFTATASPLVLSRITQVLFSGRARIIRSLADRPNIKYSVIKAYEKKRFAMLLALTLAKPMLIFCGTRNKAQNMARDLVEILGIDKVRFYHAGLTKQERDATESWFFSSNDSILCCTCAFGMGVDKKDIRTVIHLEAADTAESYIQEAGRGGRDGKTCQAILLWSPKDEEHYSKFLPNSRQAVIAKLASSTQCRRQVLLDALGAEKTICSGCDICNHTYKDYALDAMFVRDFVLKNKHIYTRAELIYALMKEASKQTYSIAGINLWEADDMIRIVHALLQEKVIKQSNILYKHTITATGKIAGVTLSFPLELPSSPHVLPPLSP